MKITDPITGKTFEYTKEVTKVPARHAVGRGNVGYKRVKYYLDQAGLSDYKEISGVFVWSRERLAVRASRRTYRNLPMNRYQSEIIVIDDFRPESLPKLIEQIKNSLIIRRTFLDNGGLFKELAPNTPETTTLDIISGLNLPKTPVAPPVATKPPTIDSPWKTPEVLEKRKKKREDKRKEKNLFLNATETGHWAPREQGPRVEVTPGILKRPGQENNQ